MLIDVIPIKNDRVRSEVTFRANLTPNYVKEARVLTIQAFRTERNRMPPLDIETTILEERMMDISYMIAIQNDHEAVKQHMALFLTSFKKQYID